MKRSATGRNLGVALLALFCCMAPVLLWPQPRIEIRADNIVCLWPRDEVILKWRHSVEKQDWQEAWRRDGDRLHLTAVYVQTFGAGVPVEGKSVPAPPGYVGMAADRHQEVLEWVVSRNMQGALISDGLMWPVSQAVPDYTPVRIAVSRRPLIRQLLTKDCL